MLGLFLRLLLRIIDLWKKVPSDIRERIIDLFVDALSDLIRQYYRYYTGRSGHEAAT